MCILLLWYYELLRYYQSLMPMKLMKAMPISPTTMKVMPRPRKGAGTLE